MIRPGELLDVTLDDAQKMAVRVCHHSRGPNSAANLFQVAEGKHGSKNRWLQKDVNALRRLLAIFIRLS